MTNREQQTGWTYLRRARRASPIESNVERKKSSREACNRSIGTDEESVISFARFSNKSRQFHVSLARHVAFYSCSRSTLFSIRFSPTQTVINGKILADRPRPSSLSLRWSYERRNNAFSRTGIAGYISFVSSNIMSENLETLYGSVLQCANFAEYCLVLSLNDYIGIYKFVLRALIQTIIPGQGRKREMEQRWSRNKVTLSPGDNKLSRREDTVYWTETRVEKQAPSFCQSTALTNRTANLYTNF